MAALLLLFGCASPRSSSIFSLKFSEQPPRLPMRTDCGAQSFTTQGTVVCEQKAPTQARISVKVPPLVGRVVYSNGELKRTDDFNWYPKEGFWIWKKQPIRDNWLNLDLGEIASTFGDWPVSIDVSAQSKIGIITTRGIIYHRICNDQDVPCSKLTVAFTCAGYKKKTGPGVMGKCERIAGSPQAFEIHLKDVSYEARPGAVLYVTSPRSMPPITHDVTPDEFREGVVKVELPLIQAGPALVGLRLSWVQDGKTQNAETRVLIVGYDPAWTGLDSPHSLNQGDHTDWVKPFLADELQVELYSGRTLVGSVFGEDVLKFSNPDPGQVACGFAWQRESSDVSTVCLDNQLNEVPIP